MLITPGQVREHFAALLGTISDDLIRPLIDRADGLMAQHCGYPVTSTGVHTLSEAQYVCYPYGPVSEDARGLRVGVAPIVRVVSAYVSLDWTYASSDLLADTEYTIDAAAGVLWLTSTATHAWACDDARANQITVRAGYMVTPPALVAITAAAVAHLFRRRTTPSGMTGATGGGQSVSLVTPRSLLPDEVLHDLAAYRLVGNSHG